MTGSTKKARTIAAHYAYFRRTLFPRPIVSLSEQGTILEISQYGNPDSIPCAEFYSGLIVPGLINAHCHLELSHLRGAIPPGSGFAGFAAGLSATRNSFTEQERLCAVSAADASMWKQGVSAVGDISNGTDSFAVKSDSGIYYHTFLELFGLNADMDRALAPVAASASEYGLTYSTTSHSLYSLEDGPFLRAVDDFPPGTEEKSAHCERRDPPLSIHFMESPEEAELYKGRGEMREWYGRRGWKTAFTDRYRSPAERLVGLVPSGRDVMLIHNCCVTEEDIDIVHSHFTGRVTWILCPRSNEYISGLTPPVGLLRRKGANIAVGTDSLASNRSLDMAAELRMFRGVPLEEILGWATRNGAEALHKGGQLGELEVGTRPEIVLMTGIDWQNMTLTPEARSERIL